MVMSKYILLYFIYTHAVFSHVHTHFYGFLFHEFVDGWDDHGQHPVSPLTLLHSFKVFLEQRADVNFNGAPAGLTPLAVACLFLGAKVKGQGTSLLTWPGAPKTLCTNIFPSRLHFHPKSILTSSTRSLYMYSSLVNFVCTFFL